MAMQIFSLIVMIGALVLLIPVAIRVFRNKDEYGTRERQRSWKSLCTR